MSLATRCPVCGTTFRVVQDQLKISEGWVRCGHCQEIFNALETLYELPAARSEPPQPAAAAAAPPRDLTDIDLGEPPASPATAPPDPLTDDAGPAASPTTPAPPDLGGPAAATPDPPAVLAVATVVAAPATAAPGPVPVVATQDPPETAAGDGEGAAGVPGAATETTAGSWAEPLDGPRAGPWPSPVEATAHPPGETATTLAADDPTAAAAVPGPAEPAPPESAELPADPTAATAALPASAMPPGAGTGPDTDQQDDPVADAREPGPMTAWAPEAAWPHLRKRRRSHALTATPSPAQDPSAAPGASPAEGPSPPDTDTPPMERPRGRRRKPEFMRQVERAAQWQRPAVRAVLGSTAAVLSMLLAGQMAWHWRDEGSARWPGLGRGLGRVCQTLGCELQAPRHLERLVLDSSQLSRTAWPGTLRLTLDLRNTADHAVRTPALDLRFTDANGQTLVRRVLLPAELGAAAPAAIEAQGLWHIDTGLNFGPLKVTGFSAEIFYP